MAILIKNGILIDGTGTAGRAADVLIVEDRIKEIGTIAEESVIKSDPETRVIDARGKIVCPGFIDMHAHSDFSIPVDGLMVEKLRQGVTTAVIGSCGFSAAPANSRYTGYLKRFTGGMFGNKCPFQWETTAQYFEYIRKKGIGGNVFAQVGLANLRTMAMGIMPGRANAGQMETMKRLLSQALDEGARGFSTGLIYPPQSMVSAEEVTELCTTLKGREVIYSTHIRNEMDGVEEAVREAVKTARKTGVSLQVSHHKVTLERNFGKSRDTMAIIEKARDEGIEADTDVYPYTSFGNILIACVAKFEPGMEDKVLFLSMKHFKECEGKTVGEVMRMKKMGIRRLVAHLALREGITGMPIAGFFMSEDDVDFLVCHPLVSIGSDGVEAFGEKTHPRLYGAFARMLEKYCREDKRLSFEEAIRKMTSLPAGKLKLKMRGILKEQYYADIVVFDPENIKDKSTYQDPVQYPEGFEAVIVNGKIAVYKDVLSGERPGRVL